MQFVRFGVPFLGFAVFGSLGLSTMLRGRLDIDDAKREVNDFRAPADVQKKRERRRKEDEKKKGDAAEMRGRSVLRDEKSAETERKLVVVSSKNKKSISFVSCKSRWRVLF